MVNVKFTMNFVRNFIFLGTFVQISSAKLTRVYDNSTFLDNGNNSVKLSWKYEPRQDVLLMALEVKATGWVGFGFAHKIFQMQGYDVIVGKVENGKGTLTDRHTKGFMEPPADLQQDYNMTYFEEVNGTTALEFHRKRLTGDPNDLNIKLGPMLVVYAYHSTLDYPSPYQTKHDHQGYKTVVLLPLDTMLPSNITSSFVPLLTSVTPELKASVSVDINSSSFTTLKKKLPSTTIPLFTTVYQQPITSELASFSSMEMSTIMTSSSPIMSSSSSIMSSSYVVTSSSPLMRSSYFVLPTSTDISKVLNLISSGVVSSSSLVLSTITSTMSSSSLVSFSSVQVPPFVIPPDVYDKYVKVSLRAKIINIQYEVIANKSKPEYIKFKKAFEENIEKRDKIWKAIVTDIRKGSVIVDYEVYVNTTSEQEARQVIDNIQQDVNKGKLGNYVVDPGFSMGSVITIKVHPTIEPSPTTSKSTELKSDNLTLIIILSCAVGLVFIMLIVTIALLICARKRNQQSAIYSLKPAVNYYEHEVNY